MASLEKKAGFLNGLLEGMDIEKESSHGKLMTGIVSLLSELCERAEAMDELLNDLNEYVESIDDDLTRLEQEGSAGDDDEDDFEFFDEDYDDLPFGGDEPPLRLLSERNKRRDAGEDAPVADDEEESSMDGGICPECKRLSFIENGDLSGLFRCPHCGKKVRLIPLSKDNTPIAAPVEED